LEFKGDWLTERIEASISKRIEEIDLIAERKITVYGRMGIKDRFRIPFGKHVPVGEKTFWKQRVGTNWILKGDSNTQFFHQDASGRRKEKHHNCVRI
jgi:hypothetical protein